jgi:hypothetical protein
MMVITGVLALVLGLLGIATFWWLPTVAIVLGVLAVAVGLLGRRRVLSAEGETALSGYRLNVLGALLGAASIIAALVVVLLTSDF